MKFIGFMLAAALISVSVPTPHGSNPAPGPPRVIVELTVPGFLSAERILVPRKKNKVVGGGGARSVSHPSPETLEGVEIWSHSYKLSLLKQGAGFALLDFRLSYEAEGAQPINQQVEIKSGEVTEAEYQDGIKLRAYFEDDS